ncbi:voltage-dependent calcium channel subunit alpha-2 delta-4 isoform x3 [Lasius niger]|uniref:Voltage-dependent calcium channel subunit alpha-2 delta-4 isoform x3 n=1 Tax=Lasius niger TaxID=67767 RepID=A0A0J7KFG2_LASNI|nr:voltage-dependent calcium channel subunit alpha-2 delta-4 isoform x3 [Lasius niger]
MSTSNNLKKSAATNQATDAVSSHQIGKRPRPCKKLENGDNEEDRGIEQQTPGVIPSQISFEEAVDNEETIAGYRLPLRYQPPPQEIEPPVHLSKLEEHICSQEITRLFNSKLEDWKTVIHLLSHFNRPEGRVLAYTYSSGRQKIFTFSVSGSAFPV